MDTITEENIQNAVPDELGGVIDTRHIVIPEGMIIEFDYQKQ